MFREHCLVPRQVRFEQVQNSILVTYKLESQVQQILFGVRCRSKQVQRNVRLGLNRKDNILITCKKIRFSKQCLVSGIGLHRLREHCLVPRQVRFEQVQNSILVTYKLESQVQQILFGVRCRSKQVQRNVRLGLNRKDNILITCKKIRFSKQCLVSGIGLHRLREHCLVPSQVSFEQVRQYIDNLQA